MPAQKSDQLRLAYLIPAMAHDEQSLADIAANSAVASLAWVQEQLGRTDVQVSCACPFMCLCLLALCVFLRLLIRRIPNFCTRYTGPAEECSKVTQNTMICFTWHLAAEDWNETCDVQLLCRHAARRGVHLPKAWKSKWNLSADVPPVDALAHGAVQRARDEFSLCEATKLDCRHYFAFLLIKHRRAHAWILTFPCQQKVCW